MTNNVHHLSNAPIIEDNSMCTMHDQSVPMECWELGSARNVTRVACGRRAIVGWVCPVCVELSDV